MVKKVISTVAVCLSLVSLSCISRQVATPPGKPPEARIAQGMVSEEAWERDWQKTLAAAKKEGNLIVYATIGAESRQAISKGFRDKFELNIEWIAAKSGELVAKLSQERRVGLYFADVFLGATGTQMTVLKPAGLLEPIKPLLVLPEVLDEKVWYGGELPWADKDKSYIVYSMLTPSGSLVGNTTMTKPEELSTYDNLLEPRWKGKIVFGEPIVIGAADNIFSALLLEKGEGFWRKFIDNSPVLTRDERLAAESVARGKYAIAAGMKMDPMVEFIKAGAPMRMWQPRDVGFLTAGGVATSLVRGAPHPASAKIFVNWLLSKEGGTIYSQISNYQSARVDVPTNHLSPENMRDPSIKYVNTATEEFALMKEANERLLIDMFRPLLK